MALIECVECHGKVSDRAKACPRCGCPVAIVVQPLPAGAEAPPPRPSLNPSSPSRPTTPPTQPRMQASPAVQPPARTPPPQPAVPPQPISITQHDLYPQSVDPKAPPLTPQPSRPMEPPSPQTQPVTPPAQPRLQTSPSQSAVQPQTEDSSLPLITEQVSPSSQPLVPGWGAWQVVIVLGIVIPLVLGLLVSLLGLGRSWLPVPGVLTAIGVVWVNRRALAAF